MNDNKKITIYDIAKYSGVAPGTVSRTLSNTGYIKEDTRKKVEEAVKHFNYIPNRAARSLKTRKTGLILLAIPDTDNPFYVDMIKSVQMVTKHNNYSMVLFYTEARAEEEIKALKMLHEDFADGMILVNLYFTQQHLNEIERIQCPLILSGIMTGNYGGKPNNKFDYIGVNTEKGVYSAVKHLIMQGHTEIGYIGGNKDMEVFRERYEGYCKALLDSGLQLSEELVFWKDYNEGSGFEAAKYFMSLNRRPTAVCAANDLLAIGSVRAFESAHIRVPDEVSVIGMDNIEISSRLKPSISSVALSQAEMGRAGAELLFNRLNGEERGPAKKIIFEPRLVIRDSSIITSKVE